MKKFAKLFGTICLASFLAIGCTTIQPLDATSNDLGSKVGEATGGFLFGTIPLGADMSIQTAAKKAGITKISTVDVKTTSYLWFWTSVTTIVTGE